MPPKRKAMADTSGNKQVATTSRNAKASKTTSTSSAPTSKPSAKAKAQTSKYSNANTLAEKPNYMNLQWPNIGDFLDDKNQDMPKDGQLVDEFCYRVSDLGFPVSEEGMELCQKLDNEIEKRDQNSRDMFIYNDWNGWAMSEAMENFLKDFNKDIFKKTVSPFKKWAYVEGIACFLKTAELMEWLNNEDGDSVKEIAQMLGLMILTSYAALAEHSLFKPDSEVKNIGIMSLLMLEFIEGPGCDLDCDWGCEVVRLCDEAGIDLGKEIRKQVDFTKKNLKDMRDQYKEKKEASDFDLALEYGQDGYKAYAEKKDWTPEDDIGDYEVKMWYRWDWKLEYKEFKKNHSGGNKYDLTKWSKKDREEYTLGTKAFSRRINIETDSEDSWETDSD